MLFVAFFKKPVLDFSAFCPTRTIQLLLQFMRVGSDKLLLAHPRLPLRCFRHSKGCPQRRHLVPRSDQGRLELRILPDDVHCNRPAEVDEHEDAGQHGRKAPFVGRVGRVGEATCLVPEEGVLIALFVEAPTVRDVQRQ